MENRKTGSEWVTVAYVNRPQEAYMMKSLLESEGMTVFLRDEMTAHTYTNAIGGIKVQVPDPEAQRAYELLSEGGYLSQEG